jgi:hypothetical protein
MFSVTRDLSSLLVCSGDKPEQNGLARFSSIQEHAGPKPSSLVTGCFDPYLARLISQGIDTTDTRQKGVLAWR